MKTVIAGGTGLIGEALIAELAQRGEVVVLSRSPQRVEGARGVQWDARSIGPWVGEIESADLLINLAGANIGEKRWTAERKRELLRSRVDSTRALTEALQRTESRPRFINASAVGIYGSRGDEVLTEESAPGAGFLSDLAREWEGAARAAEAFSNLAILRFGVVFADGGALEKMLLPFRLFAGGKLGNGRQWMSWIDLRDLVRVVLWIVDHREARGVYNVTAPQPVTNAQLTREIGRILHRPAFFTAPAIALRVALGEMADALLLSSQRAIPRKLMDEGFVFQFGDLRQSLEEWIG